MQTVGIRTSPTQPGTQPSGEAAMGTMSGNNIAKRSEGRRTQDAEEWRKTRIALWRSDSSELGFHEGKVELRRKQPQHPGRRGL